MDRQEEQTRLSEEIKEDGEWIWRLFNRPGASPFCFGNRPSNLHYRALSNCTWFCLLNHGLFLHTFFLFRVTGSLGAALPEGSEAMGYYVFCVLLTLWDTLTKDKNAFLELYCSNREAIQVVVPKGSTFHPHGLYLASKSGKLWFEAGQAAFVGDELGSSPGLPMLHSYGL